MLIKQIIEFKLRMPRPLIVRVALFLKLVIFMTKQNSPRQNHRLKYHLMLNILQKAMYRASPDLRQATYKI